MAEDVEPPLPAYLIQNALDLRAVKLCNGSAPGTDEMIVVLVLQNVLEAVPHLSELPPLGQATFHQEV